MTIAQPGRPGDAGIWPLGRGYRQRQRWRVEGRHVPRAGRRLPHRASAGAAVTARESALPSKRRRRQSKRLRSSPCRPSRSMADVALEPSAAEPGRRRLPSGPDEVEPNRCRSACASMVELVVCAADRVAKSGCELPPDFDFEIPPQSKRERPRRRRSIWRWKSRASILPACPSAGHDAGALPGSEISRRSRPLSMPAWTISSASPRPTSSSTWPISALAPEAATAGRGPSRPEAADAEPRSARAGDAIDDQVKVIGSLRIGIPLYNVYLNEADEWSRRLATEVAEWALELNQPLPDSDGRLGPRAGGQLRHRGFHSLSDIARALESTMLHTQSLAYGTAQHGKAFTDAAEEIRRLLHQFAAGFLKEPDTSLIGKLQALKQIEIPQRDDMPEDEPFSDFAGLEPEVPAEPPVDRSRSRNLSRRRRLPLAPRAGACAVPQPADAAAAAPTLRRAAAALDVRRTRPTSTLSMRSTRTCSRSSRKRPRNSCRSSAARLRQWTARPDNRSARDEALRALHTLKGSARLAGALRLGELAHRMESEIESLGSTMSRPSSTSRRCSTASTACRPTGMRCAPVAAPRRRRRPKARPPSTLGDAADGRGHRRRTARTALSQPASGAEARAEAGAAGPAGGDQPRARSARRQTRPCACAPSCWTGWSTRPAR